MLKALCSISLSIGVSDMECDQERALEPESEALLSLEGANDGPEEKDVDSNEDGGYASRFQRPRFTLEWGRGTTGGGETGARTRLGDGYRKPRSKLSPSERLRFDGINGGRQCELLVRVDRLWEADVCCRDRW
jgi:hypothetical protein